PWEARSFTGVDREKMEIKRVGTQAAASSSATASVADALSRDKLAGQAGSAEWFTGKVWIQPLFEAPDPARVRCASVTFEPCARTASHRGTLYDQKIHVSDSNRKRYERCDAFSAGSDKQGGRGDADAGQEELSAETRSRVRDDNRQ